MVQKGGAYLSTVGIPESGGQRKSSVRATLSSDLLSVTFWEHPQILFLAF